MRKNVFAAALTLVLGVGSFAACSSDDVVTPEKGTDSLGGTTFMTVKFAMPQGGELRSSDYNDKGQWGGRDKIESYKAYIFNGTNPATATLEAVQFLAGDAEFSQTLESNNYVATPKKAVRVQPGNKVVYVVVNPNATTEALLPSTLAATTLADFKAAYESKKLATAGAGVYDATFLNKATPTSTANVAKTITVGSDVKDVIVMTGEPVGLASTFTVEDGVSEADAIATSSPKNQAAVSVKRVVARVTVTSKKSSYEFKGNDPYTPLVNETDYVIGTVSNLHFVTVQGERELNFLQAQGSELTSTHAKWNSPAFAQTVTTNYSTATTEAASILKQYDYTNLWKKKAAADKLGGNQVPAMDQTWDAEKIGKLTNESDFILPTTHKYVAFADGADYKYRKGNTAYVLVRAAFVPQHIVVGKDYSKDAAVAAARAANDLSAYVTAVQNATHAVLNTDATVKTPVAQVAWTSITAGSEPAELVYGVSTKKFYTSEYASQDPVFQGEFGQPIQKFGKVVEGGKVGYKMLYFAWVNPDNTDKWYNSPVYRNNIYHIEIDGIGGLGEGWNPLVPATPEKPSNDKDHPNNPDPYRPNTQVKIPVPTPGGGTIPPENPVTPPDNPVTPIKPEDPLTQKKTHMSVKVTVLPWQVHSYKKKLEN